MDKRNVNPRYQGDSEVDWLQRTAVR